MVERCTWRLNAEFAAKACRRILLAAAPPSLDAEDDDLRQAWAAFEYHRDRMRAQPADPRDAGLAAAELDARLEWLAFLLRPSVGPGY